MLSLSATFENSEGGLHRFNMKDPDRTKSAEEIRAGLEKLVSLNLFEKGEVGLFKKLVSAKFVETIETPIFDLRKEDLAEIEPEVDMPSEFVQAQSAPIQAIPVEPVFLQNASKRTLPDQKCQLELAQLTNPVPASQEIQQLEIIIPEDFDSSALSEEELLAFLTAQLPAGATLESFQTADIVFTMEGAEDKPPKSALTKSITEAPQHPMVEKAVQPVTEKRVDWVPKPKSKFKHLLSGLPWDKRKRKKALRQLEKNRKKE